MLKHIFIIAISFAFTNGSFCMSEDELMNVIFKTYLYGDEGCPTCMILSPRTTDEHLEINYIAHINADHSASGMLQCNACSIRFDSLFQANDHYLQCEKSEYSYCTFCKKSILKYAVLSHICTAFQSNKDAWNELSSR